jgi:nitrogen-specific signal transduction histidine kinase
VTAFPVETRQVLLNLVRNACEAATRKESRVSEIIAGRHDYEDVAAKLVWDTVQLALPPLQAVVLEEIEREAMGRL